MPHGATSGGWAAGLMSRAGARRPAGRFDHRDGGSHLGVVGSPLVDHAKTLAVMPSLHVGWALWVSVVLACVAGGVRLQALSGVHVLVTVFVIVATANHYLVDA